MVGPARLRGGASGEKVPTVIELAGAAGNVALWGVDPPRSGLSRPRFEDLLTRLDARWERHARP
jgi:hypothetical protein